MYTVIEFYPTLGVRTRAVQYERLEEGLNHCGQLKWFAEVPYILIDDLGHILDKEQFEMTGEEMARIVEEDL